MHPWLLVTRSREKGWGSERADRPPARWNPGKADRRKNVTFVGPGVYFDTREALIHMGSLVDLNGRRGLRRPTVLRPASNLVVCAHCGERHPLVKLRGGESRCVTAFFDGSLWFCLNRGCRHAWLERRSR